MATLSVTKNYADGTVLFESDLDAIASSIETFLNVTGINDDNIQDSGITASTKLVNASISEGKLGSNIVTNTKLRQSAGLSVIGRSANSTGNVADITAGSNEQVLMRTGDALSFAQVDTAQIADDAVTTAKIDDSAITNAKMANDSVGTDELVDASVTAQKRAALGQQISASSDTFTTTSSGGADVTNLSVSITTTGRPVMILLIGESSINSASIGGTSSASSVSGTIRIFRDATAIAAYGLGTPTSANPSMQVPPSSVSTIDVPSAGSYTYKIQAQALTGTTIAITRCRLVAYEL